MEAHFLECDAEMFHFHLDAKSGAALVFASWEGVAVTCGRVKAVTLMENIALLCHMLHTFQEMGQLNCRPEMPKKC